MKKQFMNLVKLIPALLLAVSILVLTATNVPVLLSLLRGLSVSTVEEFTTTLDPYLSENLVQRYEYIDTYGTLAKNLGVDTLNERQRLADGSLAVLRTRDDSAALTERIGELSDFLGERDIDFLCVPVPGKINFYDTEFAPGHEGMQRQWRAFMDLLRQRGIPMLDLDRWYQENGWDLEKTYFRTDHHWTPEASFAAFRQIMEFFAEEYGIPLDQESTRLENWKVDVYEDKLLGSNGKRTSIAYGGLDDLSHIYPQFPTEAWTCFMTQSDQYVSRAGAFDLSLLDVEDLYNSFPYSLYMGGDFPVQYVCNPSAVHDSRILCVGDSYQLPVDAFLTTQFREVYHMDLRYYKDGTFGEFVSQIQPDHVLLLFQSLEDSNVHQYSPDQWNQTYEGKLPEEPVVTQERLTLRETASPSDFYLLTANLEPGAYEMSLGDISLENAQQREAEFVQFSVTDLKTGAEGPKRYFISGSQEPQKWYFTIPEDSNYGIRIYNGVKGSTAGNSLDLTDLSLSRLK